MNTFILYYPINYLSTQFNDGKGVDSKDCSVIWGHFVQTSDGTAFKWRFAFSTTNCSHIWKISGELN